MNEQAIVKRIDHLLIRIDEPGYSELFTLLSRTLQLPIAWMISSYPGLKSGGIFAGNVNLEIAQFTSAAQSSTGASLYGLALEPPSLEEALSELKRRSIPHTPPLPFTQSDAEGEKMTLWQNVLLGDIADSNMLVKSALRLSRTVPSQLWSRTGNGGDALNNTRSLGMLERIVRNGLLFLCAYNPERYEIFEDRAANTAVLRARNGGPLGIESLREIQIGVKDLATTMTRWEQLLAPLEPTEQGVWKIGDGPAIRFHTDSEARTALIWQVRSLETARAFLETQALLGRVTERQLCLDSNRLFGLDMRLVV